MAKPLSVICIVGLTPEMLGLNTPNLNVLASDSHVSPLRDVFPAVTTTAQSCMLTGLMPNRHGIVGNGWYFRDLAEVMFWKQANHLVQAEKVWEGLRQEVPGFSCSKLFWWYNMYASVDRSVTPRPHYLADGGKLFDLYSSPPGYHQSIEAAIGTFPFFTFWGPKSCIDSSRWIAEAALLDFTWHRPSLQLVYLPHLDYNLQRLGPDDAAVADDICAIDAVAGKLINGIREGGGEVIVVSEYGITPVRRPVHINRVLRERGHIQVRQTGHFENLDAGASAAFAVADHQCAHVYVNQPALTGEIKALLEATPGIEQVLDREAQIEWEVDHPRSGDLIAIAEPDAWFTYYYWLDDKLAPDFARTVDIHRKAGFDPVELFVDSRIRFPALAVGTRLLKKHLGFRMLMNVIPMDASLVKGSHGRPVDDPMKGPLLICPKSLAMDAPRLTDVRHIIERHVRGGGRPLSEHLQQGGKP